MLEISTIAALRHSAPRRRPQSRAADGDEAARLLADGDAAVAAASLRGRMRADGDVQADVVRARSRHSTGAGTCRRRRDGSSRAGSADTPRAACVSLAQGHDIKAEGKTREKRRGCQRFD